MTQDLEFPIEAGTSSDERQGRPSGRDEMNLADFPFALLKRQQSDEDSYTYEGWITDPNGQRHRQKWTVRGAGGLGLPTEYDERVLVALMALSAEGGFEERRVPFSVYQVLKVMGVARSQRAYEAMQRSLERLLGVTIYAEGAFWDHREKTWVKMKSGFHIIDKFWLAYLEEDERVREAEGVPGYFVWSEDIWKSIQAGYLKYLDLDFYFDLTLPLARRMYRLLDKRMAYQETYEIDIFDLAGRLGMARYHYPSEVARKLQPGLDELIAKGFLARAEVVKVGRYTRLRFYRQPSGAALPAPPAVVPAAARAARAAVTPIAPAGEPLGTEDAAEVAALVAVGFTPKVAQEVVAQYGAAHTGEKRAFLRWELEVRRKSVRSPRGWLRRAIEENYVAPPGYDPRWWDAAPEVPAPVAAQLQLDVGASEVDAPEEVAAASREREVWGRVLQHMQQQLTTATYEALFTRTTLVKVQEEVAVISVPSAHAQAWLENRLQARLAEVLSEELGFPVRPLFVRFGG